MKIEDLYQINEDYYYVYEHILDGEVFYVGKGKGLRIFDTTRNQKWIEFTAGKLNKIDFSIKAYFLDEEDAYAFEQLLIEKHLSEGKDLTNYDYNYNHIKPSSKKDEIIKKSTKKTVIHLEYNFNHYKQAISLMKKTIEKKEKIIIFFDSKNSSLISEIQKDKTFNCGTLTESIDKKNKVSIPESFNVLLYPSNLLLINKSLINHNNVGLVIMIVKSERRKMLAINRFEEIKILSNKVSKKEKINLELIIPEEFLDTPLTNADKERMSKILNLTSCNGVTLKWRGIKDIILTNNSGYSLSEGTKTINNKRTRVTTISVKNDYE